MTFFSQEILSLCPLEALYRVSIHYYTCNWSKSVWWWVIKPILVFSLAQAEQLNNYYKYSCNKIVPLHLVIFNVSFLQTNFLYQENKRIKTNKQI